MKINGTGGINSISGVYNKQGIRSVEKSNRVIGKDQVSVSQTGQDYNTAMKALKEMPDVREDKVEEFKSQVENNTYDVPSKDIIEKLMQKAAEKRV